MLNKSCCNLDKFSDSNETDVKWALISGASSGIGKEFAKKLPKRGFKVAAVGRTLIESVDAFFPIDLEDPHLADLEIMDEFMKKHNFTLLVNAAGVEHDAPTTYKDMSLAKAVTLTRSNTNSILFLTKLAIANNPTIRIVTISSALTYIPSPLLTVFAANKAFISKFSNSLKQEGIDTVLLEPYMITSKKLASSIISPSASTYVDWLLKWGSYPPHRLLAFTIKHVPIMRSFIKQYIVYKIINDASTISASKPLKLR